MLGILVWASIASGAMAYYYLEQVRYEEQYSQKQQLLNELAENYSASANKRNLLSAEYCTLHGEYQWPPSDNYFVLMDKYEKLLIDLEGNYTSTLNASVELNETYNDLFCKFQALNEKSIVTKEEFGLLLDEFYNLFATLAVKEMECYLGQTGQIKANLCIDYGNQTVEWHNVSTFHGTTLFDLTRKVAKVDYSYWPTMKPGHILVNSINNCSAGYWVWYYWDNTKNEWIFGPVGCDAWILKNDGIYNWTCVE